MCVGKAKLPGDPDLRMEGLGDGSHCHVSLVHFVVSVGKKNIDSGGRGPDKEKLAALHVEISEGHRKSIICMW